MDVQFLLLFSFWTRRRLRFFFLQDTLTTQLRFPPLKHFLTTFKVVPSNFAPFVSYAHSQNARITQSPASERGQEAKNNAVCVLLYFGQSQKSPDNFKEIAPLPSGPFQKSRPDTDVCGEEVCGHYLVARETL